MGQSCHRQKDLHLCVQGYFGPDSSKPCRLWPQRRRWHPTPVFLPGKSHGRRSLVGGSPWGREELDTTDWLHFHALEKEMATHSSVLAWRTPGTGEPGGLPSRGLHRVGHDWSDLPAAATDCGLPGFSVRGFSRQEYWSILADIGCHTLLEHCISCCPSRQPRWVPGAARTPATQAAVPPPHLALTGANPSPPGQPQELNPSGRPSCRRANRTTVETQGQCGWGRRPKTFPAAVKLQIKSTWSIRQLCVCGIYKRPLRAPAKENALALMTVGIGGKNTQEQDQVRIWVAPTAGPETSNVGGHPREVRWTVTPSEGKDSDSSDSGKIFIILIFWLVL